MVLLATNGDLELLKGRLLSGTGKINEQDSNGYSPLMAAASYGQLDVLKFLLSWPGVEVNLVDLEGDSALHYCTSSVECMKALLAAGGKLDLKNEEGKTPLESMENEFFK